MDWHLIHAMETGIYSGSMDHRTCIDHWNCNPSFCSLFSNSSWDGRHFHAEMTSLFLYCGTEVFLF